MAKTRIPLIFGTMTMGVAGKNQVRTSDPKVNQEILDVFFSHGHTELDTAGEYGEGTTEPTLAELELRGATLDTKVAPSSPGDHSPEKLAAKFAISRDKVKGYKIRTLYLHAPDRSVPFESTLRGINELYNQGHFEIFGLSNYLSWEVAEIVTICKNNGWVQPKIYQAMYNAITRGIETELIACCRKFGIRIVVYNPLAGGFFAGKLTRPDDIPTSGRFNPNSPQGKTYRARYLKQGYFDALNLLQPIADKHNIRLTSIALRWCQHHSALTPEDGIIIGASGLEQVKQNCKDSEDGPLPEEILNALDEAWKIVGSDAPPYWR